MKPYSVLTKVLLSIKHSSKEPPKLKSCEDNSLMSLYCIKSKCNKHIPLGVKHYMGDKSITYEAMIFSSTFLQKVYKNY